MADARTFSTAVQAKNIKVPGMWRDAGAEAPRGLYLQVTPSTTKANGITKSWLLRYKLNSTTRYMGLGDFGTIGLADARDAAREARKLILQDIDPIDERARRRAEKAKQAKPVTFADAAERYIAAKRSEWTNPKHAQQWRSSLDQYAIPIMGKLLVGDIGIDDVMRVMEQRVAAFKNYPAGTLWTARPETASRVRGRIESILDWATARELRSGDNPARWTGRLEHLLAERPDAENMRALPYKDAPAFFADLQQREGVSARALELLMLTASRTGEVRKARWREFDLDERTWTRPAENMKGRREHRVPLSDAAMKLLAKVRPRRIDSDALVFPGAGDKPLSDMSLTAVLRRMERHTDTVPHGLRSTFRTWGGNETSFPREILEAALAHRVGTDDTERAYMRGDLFERRRKLMDAWASYCQADENVTRLRNKRAAR